jgi:hypothetical protein
MDSVTDENVEKIFRERGAKEVELETTKSTTINQFWCSELDSLREEYIIYKEERQRLMSGIETKKKTKVVSKGTVVKKSVKKVIIDDI